MTDDKNKPSDAGEEAADAKKAPQADKDNKPKPGPKPEVDRATDAG